MEYYIRHKVLGRRMPDYDCSNESLSTAAVPLGQIIVGVSSMLYGIVAIFAYSLCIIAMTQGKLMRKSCFKIMFFLGIVDVLTVCVNSVLTGYLLIVNAVYCTYPDLIYIAGSIGLSMWCCSCFACFLLICNRLCALWWQGGGWPPLQTHLLLLAASLYGSSFLLFTRPILHNSPMSAWFFDPMIKSASKQYDYENLPHSINNLFVVLLTAAAYSVFIIILRAKYKRHEQRFSFNNNPIVIQAVIMCSFNMVASIVYVYMQWNPSSQWLVIAGQASWQFGHGCPAFIYIVLNRTIRRRVLVILGIYSTPPITVLPKTITTRMSITMDILPSTVNINQPEH